MAMQFFPAIATMAEPLYSKICRHAHIRAPLDCNLRTCRHTDGNERQKFLNLIISAFMIMQDPKKTLNLAALQCKTKHVSAPREKMVIYAIRIIICLGELTDIFERLLSFQNFSDIPIHDLQLLDSGVELRSHSL